MPHSGGVQGQAGCDFKEPDLLKGVSARAGVGMRWSLKVHSTLNHSVILWKLLQTDALLSFYIPQDNKSRNPSNSDEPNSP